MPQSHPARSTLASKQRSAAGAPAGVPHASTTLFVCGDVMTGRGIDQILAHPGNPALFEPHVRDARDYVALAERAAGPIPRAVPPDYIWGAALDQWTRFQPALRIVNLETAVTTSDSPWPNKGIHYRMHPQNVHCLTAARIDCCCLANNHVLDWGRAGLLETLDTLHAAGISTAGAGPDRDAARAPAVIPLSDGRRVLVSAIGDTSSGIPPEWQAGEHLPGIHVIDESDPRAIGAMKSVIEAARRPGDLVVISIHWGGNWGFTIPAARRSLAHRLIDDVGADLVHGHSSHHVQPIELYRGRPILYGCGDFLTDYEGIGGHTAFRPDLSLMYFVTFDVDRTLPPRLQLVPLRMHRLQLSPARASDIDWLDATLNRESRPFGTHVERDSGSALRVCAT